MGGFYTLKQHKEFQHIYKKGKSIHSANLVLFYLPKANLKNVGFTATKKIGNAVKRNRAKRRLRSLFCQYSESLKDATYIFVAKQAINEASHKQLQNDFKKVLQKSNSILEKNR
ncbi:ribonuclease P protein component [Sulfurimonas hongkongensis]|uniref:ribonuclease P protein component n=1 Tax=Sulfurimonas hongkongensis TaxID=1172190 RepID=UPI0008FEEB60|nr:ribonuclease P protein component [Sulfurimonas hongkongensis]